jgi:hypothetical protein
MPPTMITFDIVFTLSFVVVLAEGGRRGGQAGTHGSRQPPQFATNAFAASGPHDPGS